VRSVRALASRILVVDSHSTDGTLELMRELGCEVVSHAFENYAAQRNWAQAYARLDAQAWVLHLDADEVASPELVASIRRALAAPRADGYLLRRLTHFLGHPIRYGHMNPNWHLRLFRAGKGRCEDRLYDQHFVLDGDSEKLDGLLHDLQLISIERWTATHNRWSTAEAQEIVSALREEAQGKQLGDALIGDPRMRRRWMKNKLYGKAPLLLRAFVLFLYSYFFRFGILDGRVGFIYHILHAFWFRFLVDAKIYELRRAERVATTGTDGGET
jgi:glycosyltransferase involved in cell wall biosynthesis